MVITYSRDTVNRDSTIQSEVRRNSSSLSAVRTIVPSRPDAYYSCFFRPDDVPSHVRTQSVQHHLSGRCASSVRAPTLYREASVPACFRSDVSAARPDAYQFLNDSLILSKFKKGKINQPSGRCGIPSGRVSP